MYFKLLELFVLKVLFNKDEYKPTSKNFNPLRFVMITLLLANVPFTIYILTKLNRIYVQIETVCPLAIENAIDKKKQDKKTIVVVPKK